MVQIENLSFGYASGELFRNLCLTLEPGMIYGLLGKNGAGKTSLLKLVSGQLFPAAGSVGVLGYEARLREPGFLREIYFLPEEFSLPALSGRRYAALAAPFYPRFDFDRLDELCEGFEIDPAKTLTQVSLGQKKKFLLAFGLATGARLIILDEPTNGLDIPSKRQFRRLVASSLEEEQSIVISTHQVRDMDKLIDPIVILDSGRILFSADTSSMARGFSMSLERGEPAPGEAVYSEKVPGGYSVVRENRDGSESDIDIEVFFNMVISRGDEVGRILADGRKGGRA
jgi:ABC-2 type transport system ATP-binding protein